MSEPTKFMSGGESEQDAWVSVKDKLPIEEDFKPTGYIALINVNVAKGLPPIVGWISPFDKLGTITHWRRIIPPTEGGTSERTRN